MLPSSLFRARRRGRRTGGTITRSRRRILTLLGLGLLGLGLLPLCFFTVDAGGVAIADIGYYGLWVSVGLSLISGAEYTIGYYKSRS